MSFTITIDGKEVSAEPKETLLDVCRRENVWLPTLCAVDGLTEVGACRLCLLEVEGTTKLLPACTTPAVPYQKVRTDSDTLRHYRRMILELFFSERNHMCGVCVANNHCELQALAVKTGIDHFRYPFLQPPVGVDATHKDFVLDQNRCILCTRCVRVCDEIETAHVWDVMGRGVESRLISDFNRPWGESADCTSCGKCVQLCPTGALWKKGAVPGDLKKDPSIAGTLAARRKELA